jgi:hypothetical protein
VIQATAADHGRILDPEHFGAVVPYCDGPIPDLMAAALTARRPDVHPSRVIASGLDRLRQMIGEHIEAGGSKFVVIPVAEPDHWEPHLAEVADALLPLQN